MKRSNFIILILFLFLSSAILYYIIDDNKSKDDKDNFVDFTDISSKPKRDKSKDKRSGPEMENYYFE